MRSTYKIFPIEVVSNTHDFDVRQVVHGGRSMRGVFAKRAITTQECSVFMGIYPGYRVRRDLFSKKVAAYAAKQPMDKHTAGRRLATYVLSTEMRDPGYLLDPTDAHGNLLPEFNAHLSCYLNEPPPRCAAKAVFAYNLPRKRYEVWLLRAVEKDEEVYLYYGKNYTRDYPINTDGCDDRSAHYIPMESIFLTDQRACPPPLQVDMDFA